LRQLQFDQRERRIGPGAHLDQLLEPFGLADLSLRRKAAAGLVDDIGDQRRGDCERIVQPIAEHGGVLGKGDE
jgi:hypothetical protein